MAQVFNSELIRELARAAKIQQSRESTPNQLAEKIIPTVEVNPRLTKTINIWRNVGSTATGSSTIYAVPSNQDFYLTGVSLFMMDNAASDNTGTYLEATIDGIARKIIIVRKLTLTAASYAITREFTFPIKIDRGTNINIVNAFTVGASTREGIICGYVDESSTA